MTDFQFHMFAIPLIYAPLVFGFYASIAFYRKINVAKASTWLSKTITTNLSSRDFIMTAQNLCAAKNLFLLDIDIESDDHIKVVIKENPSLFWWFGQMYYIEYRVVEKPQVTVFTRGCVFEKYVNNCSYKNTINSFVR